MNTSEENKRHQPLRSFRRNSLLPSRQQHLFFFLSLSGIVLIVAATFLYTQYRFLPLAHAEKASGIKNPTAIEQQIDIQDANMSSTSSAYSDANGSGYFQWNSSRYGSLQHVYFEAGIAKASQIATTKRVRSADILPNLVNGTVYKVRMRYACVYNSSANTFAETGYAELWSADTSIEVTSSAVSNTINSSTGTCPANPSTVAVRFSRLIILQSDPNQITDTNTMINIGHTELRKLPDTNDDPLTNPKIWMYADHSQHQMAGWDSIKDMLFSATLASPKGNTVSACLYDITSSSEITCVSTTSITPTFLTGSDISSALHDGDQYETYLKVSTANTPVLLYNSFVTVEQSKANGLSSLELYYDFNPYNIAQNALNYSRGYFPNYWESANFNIPSNNEILGFYLEATQSIASSPATASVALYNTCLPNAGCYPGSGGRAVLGANLDTTNTAFTRVRTVSNVFAMPAANELDESGEVKTGTGTVTSNNTWLIINLAIIPTYSFQYLTNIAYGPQPNEMMDECLPIGASSSQPGMVLVHGGGWGQSPTTRTFYTWLCKSLAAKGYVTYNIDYRNASSSAQTDNPWPDQIGDVQLAVRNMRQNAASLGVDPSRICALGDSSGSQLALLLGYMQSIYPSDVSTISATFSPTVQCVVDQFGPSDLTKLYNEVPGDQQALYDYLDNQTPTSDPTIYQNASPITYVTSQSAQTLITQGTQDYYSVPQDQAQELQQLLQQSNVPVQYIPFVGGHEYTNISVAQRQIIWDQIYYYLLSTEHP